MKRSHLFLNFLMLLLFCISLYSCLSVDRKIKINKDGSGEEVMKIEFMKEFYSLMTSMTLLMDSTRKESFMDSLYSDKIFLSKVKEEYDSIHGITNVNIYSEKNADSSNAFIIKYSFDSLNKVGSALEKAVDEEDENKNPTIVTMNRDGNDIVFNYLYEQPASDEFPENDSLTDKMKSGIAEMFGNGFVNFEIEFPYDVISSNATSAAGNTLTWHYPMTEVFMNSKMMLEVRMKE